VINGCLLPAELRSIGKSKARGPVLEIRTKCSSLGKIPDQYDPDVTAKRSADIMAILGSRFVRLELFAPSSPQDS
jgi:hypothetical protein